MTMLDWPQRPEEQEYAIDAIATLQLVLNAFIADDIGTRECDLARIGLDATEALVKLLAVRMQLCPN